jgi:hypothetical protein
MFISNRSALSRTSTRSAPVRLVKPGDTVHVRGESRWYLGRAFPEPPVDGWLRNVSVSAELQIEGVNDFIPLVDSTNTVKIQLLQR